MTTNRKHRWVPATTMLALLLGVCLDRPVVAAARGLPEHESFSVTEGLRKPLQLVWIKAGTFVMGSPASEAAHRKNEMPQTTVEISRGFWMGSFEVTHGQWRDVMGTDLRHQATLALKDKTEFELGAGSMRIQKYFGLDDNADASMLLGNAGDDVPMIWVSWEESVSFTRHLTQIMRQAGEIPDGYEFRLPTEAEWEYAARAGTKGATHAGDMVLAADGSAAVLEGIAWYASNSGTNYQGKVIDASTWITRKEGAAKGGPRDVGTKAPNPWGLYDMLGNAAEWCADWYGPLPGGEVRDWPGNAWSKKGRIRRGGGWSTFAGNARAGYRNAHEENFRWINLGFRVVLAEVKPGG